MSDTAAPQSIAFEWMQRPGTLPRESSFPRYAAQRFLEHHYNVALEWKPNLGLRDYLSLFNDRGVWALETRFFPAGQFHDFAVQCQHARAALIGELLHQLTRIAQLKAGWAGRGSVPPSKDVVQEALVIGLDVIEFLLGSPQHLNMSAAADGCIEFIVFGHDEELEFWVGDEPGRFTYLLSSGHAPEEGTRPVRDISAMLDRLRNAPADRLRA